MDMLTFSGHRGRIFLMVRELFLDPMMLLSICVARRLVGHLLILNPRERAKVSSALESLWIAEDLEDLEAAYATKIRLNPLKT
jgi:hypothetical protein